MLKKLIIKFLYNEIFNTAAKKLLKKFPKIRNKLVDIRNGISIKNIRIENVNSSIGMIRAIKKDVELRKKEQRQA